MDAPALVYSNDKSPADWGYTAPDGKSGVIVNPLQLQMAMCCKRRLPDSALPVCPVFAYDAINNGLLRPVLSDYDWTGFDVFAVYPKTTILPKRTRAFVDFMASRYGKDPVWNKIHA